MLNRGDTTNQESRQVKKNIKEKTVSGLIWSFIDSFSSQILTFIVGIILARMLDPAAFGLVGMTTIFIAVSETFINSGFGPALIRKNNCTEKDYSTVFFFNLATGTFLFLLLFVLAPLIGRFFDQPQLSSIVRILSVILIIDSLTIIQRTTLTKRINFRLQTRISIIAGLLSGIVSIWMAFRGYGVWSLIAKTIIQRTVSSLLLWLWNRWRPILVFSAASFKELFRFGSNLLISGLIDTVYRNVYYLIIGKYFSAEELGFYTRADRFKALPSENLNNVILKVSYPVLSEIKDDNAKLKAGYKRLLTSTMLISFVLMIGMAATAEPMVLTLIGGKWISSVVYLQMLCFVGMLYPLHSLNLNILLVKGCSNLGLRLEIIKKILAVPIIIIGIFWGMKPMIVGMMINSVIAYGLNGYWSGRLIGYPMKEQITDILPSFGVAVFTGAMVYLVGVLLPVSPTYLFLIQLVTGTALVFIVCEAIRLKEYMYIKDLVLEKIRNMRGIRNG